MIVRRAELSDIPAVAALERAEFPDGADEGMLARLWETDGGVILAAEEGNDLLGYVWARFVLDEGDIGNVAVAPDSRRRGIGAALLKALFAESERRGAAVLQLEVRESNLAARRLYEKNGFEIVGKRKNYYEKPAEDAILMSKFFQKEAEKRNADIIRGIHVRRDRRRRDRKWTKGAHRPDLLAGRPARRIRRRRAGNRVAQPCGGHLAAG